jgi:hypothetical protein
VKANQANLTLLPVTVKIVNKGDCCRKWQTAIAAVPLVHIEEAKSPLELPRYHLKLSERDKANFCPACGQDLR